jgi:hypothetical protein
MNETLILPCECPDIDEQTATILKITINPTLRPAGTRLFESDEMLCKGFLIQVQAAQTTKAYLGYKDARELGACFEIAPGDNRFIGVSESMEKVVAIARPRLRPYNWLLNSSATMTATVVLFL